MSAFSGASLMITGCTRMFSDIVLKRFIISLILIYKNISII